MEEKKVSIVIPTRNRIIKLKNCLDSIKNQTYNNIETVVVDNNSDKEQIQFLENYPNIKIIKRTQNNFVDALNQGIKESSGDYIVQLDDDNVLPPQWITEMINLFNNEPESTGIIKSKPVEVYGPNYIMKHKRYMPNFGISGAMLKKEVFEKTGYYSKIWEWFLVDADYSVKVINKGFKILYVPKPIHFHNSNTWNINLEKDEDNIYYHGRNGFWLILMHYPLRYFPIELSSKFLIYSYKCLKIINPKLFYRIIKDTIKRLPYCIKNREIAKEIPYGTIWEYITKNNRANWRDYLDPNNHKEEFNQLLKKIIND